MPRTLAWRNPRRQPPRCGSGRGLSAPSIDPRLKPVQPDGPPILAGAIFPDSIRRAARRADGISGFSFGPSADEIRIAFPTPRMLRVADLVG